MPKKLGKGLTKQNMKIALITDGKSHVLTTISIGFLLQLLPLDRTVKENIRLFIVKL